MKIKSLAGKEYKLNISKYVRHKDDTESQSALHLTARQLIQKTFPYVTLAEEVFVPGEKLYLDFLLPHKMLCVEVHGRQHYDYIEHFHKNRLAFIESKKRDLRKQRWCEFNEIVLVVLPYNESIEQWYDRLVNYWNSGGTEEAD